MPTVKLLKEWRSRPFNSLLRDQLSTADKPRGDHIVSFQFSLARSGADEDFAGPPVLRYFQFSLARSEVLDWHGRLHRQHTFNSLLRDQLNHDVEDRN